MIQLAPILNFFDNGIGRAIVIIIILVLTFIIERIVRAFFNKHMNKSTKLIKVDHTQFTVFKHLLSAIIYILGISVAIYLIPTLKTLSISIFASAGVLAIIIGFASQQAFSNVISGIFIAIFKPFRVGDMIKFGERIGTVEDITLRHTVLRNFENKRVIVPNSVISNEVIENFHIGEEKICRYVEFGISYDSDVDKAMKIIAEESAKHPEFVDTRSEKEKKSKKSKVEVRVMGYGDFTVNLRAWVWAKDPKAAFRLGTDLNRTIKQRFDKEGIEIPFPYRTIVYKKDLRKK
jgi:small-conductance mechanosensitive channel